MTRIPKEGMDHSYFKNSRWIHDRHLLRRGTQQHSRVGFSSVIFDIFLFFFFFFFAYRFFLLDADLLCSLFCFLLFYAPSDTDIGSSRFGTATYSAYHRSRLSRPLSGPRHSLFLCVLGFLGFQQASILGFFFPMTTDDESCFSASQL
jgi:hypothetical protein